jgi:hypothetical protein
MDKKQWTAVDPRDGKRKPVRLEGRPCKSGLGKNRETVQQVVFPDGFRNEMPLWVIEKEEKEG